MKVFAFGKAVVNQKRRTALARGRFARFEAVRQRGHKGFGLAVNFGQVVVLTGDLHRRAQVGHTVFPLQGRGGICAPHHATLVPDTALAHQQLHGHGIEHFIAHHHPTELLGQGVNPLHLVRIGFQGFLLTRAQATRQIHDGVALHAVAQTLQQLQGQRARTRAKFQHLVGTGHLQGLGHLMRQRVAKVLGHFGGGGKVAAALGGEAQLAQVVGVIAHAGRIQGQGHEAVKAQPTTGIGDAALNQGVQSLLARVVG